MSRVHGGILVAARLIKEIYLIYHHEIEIGGPEYQVD
jgi:hypothetical protein